MKSYPKDNRFRYISIARFNKFWNGEEFKLLAPPADIIKIKDEKLYTKLYYEKVLNKLNPQKVYNQLGNNAILLCHEKWTDIKDKKTFCHRRIVAKWLEESLEIKVEELGETLRNESKSDCEQLHF